MTSESIRQYVIGMAGHIDHGKTALIQALTGINTDRLKEEQERGITIDLGFAHLSSDTTVIDVPGHERLIKNMVAGVSTIDMVLFVIAADDGIMPQTREHFDIVNLLGITQGIFVITKSDLVQEDWLLLVKEEVEALLKDTPFADSPVLTASTVNGSGIEDVRQAIQNKLEEIPARKDDGIFRLPIDRVFSKTGFGTVVTGSVLSGAVRIGDTVEILPEKISARIRGLQSHDEEAEKVKTGNRAALNLAGVNHGQLYRGQVITLPDLYEAAQIFNARLDVLPSSSVPIKNQMRLRIHLHTLELFARVIIPAQQVLEPGSSAYVQIRLESPVFAAFEDRFVIRQYSPQVTLGGGVVLETNPPRYRKKYQKIFEDTLEKLETTDPSIRIPAAFSLIEIYPLNINQIRVRTGLPAEKVSSEVARLTGQGKLRKLSSGKEDIYFSAGQLNYIADKIAGVLKNYHRLNPGRPGLKPKELISHKSLYFLPELITSVMEIGVKDVRFKWNGDYLALADFESRLSAKSQDQLEKLEKLYREAGFNPPIHKEAAEQLSLSEKEFRELGTILRDRGYLILAEERLYFHRETLGRAIEILRDFFQKNKELKVPEFKDLIGSSRKYAIPLLTYMDNHQITRREGDVRIAGDKL